MDGHRPELVRQMKEIQARWTEPRFAGIERGYTALDVARLRGSVKVEHTLADRGARRLWKLLHEGSDVSTFGALTGSQAVQMVAAGLKAIYVSGWQVAADANLAGQTYPDQSLYPSSSAPALVRRINNALMRRDQMQSLDGRGDHIDWYAPILADAEAGFGGPIHAFELMRAMIEAGAAGVHFEDQLAAEKKCGHMGGKVVVPTSQFILTLKAARLAADVLDVTTVLVARTDTLGARLLTSDIDPRDREFVTGERTPEGYFVVRAGLDAAMARALSYAPYADMLWFETSRPDLEEARRFAEAIHDRHPGKVLAYNCSPSFNWKSHMSESQIAAFQGELGRLGYKFQFVTLAGWHLVNLHSFEMASALRTQGMPAYVDLQERELAREPDGYSAVKHQQEAGAGYFDQVLMTVTGGQTSTAALAGSTEAAQFH